MCHLCAKGFFDYEFNSADVDKISNFNEIASNFTYSWTSKFLKYNWTDRDHLLLKSKFYGRGKSGMYFSIFGSCQPLILLLTFNFVWLRLPLPRYNNRRLKIAWNWMKTRPDSLVQLKSGSDSHWRFRIRHFFVTLPGLNAGISSPIMRVSLQNDSRGTSSSNESVLSTIISFQIYIPKKTRFYEKNFEEIFAALLLAQISSKFFF